MMREQQEVALNSRREGMLSAGFTSKNHAIIDLRDVTSSNGSRLAGKSTFLMAPQQSTNTPQTILGLQ